jgi:hypothetical protein
MWSPEYDGQQGGRDAELEDVIEFFKQAEIDAVRCGYAVDLGELTRRLERGEHRW